MSLGTARLSATTIRAPAHRITGIGEHLWAGHRHGLTPDKSQMLPFTLCMGSASLPLATSISALPILGSIRLSGELKCVT